MEFHANEGKDVLIQANGKVYAQHAITTHFVQVGESYIDLVERYVKPVYQLIAICRRCEGNIVLVRIRGATIIPLERKIHCQFLAATPLEIRLAE